MLNRNTRTGPRSGQRSFHTSMRGSDTSELSSDKKTPNEKNGEVTDKKTYTKTGEVKHKSKTGTDIQSMPLVRAAHTQSPRRSSPRAARATSGQATPGKGQQDRVTTHNGPRVPDLEAKLIYMRETPASAKGLSKSLMGTQADPILRNKHALVNGARSIRNPAGPGENADSTPTLAVYKDSWQNRKLKRVGKVVGTARFNSRTGTTSVQLYVDSPENRKLNRVGLPRGSLPRERKSAVTKTVPKIIEQIRKGDEFDSSDASRTYKHSFELALCRINRHEEVSDWKRAHKGGYSITSLSTGVKFFEGVEIPDSELTDGQLKVLGKIGFGLCGSVYFATWMDAVLAVKKIAIHSSKSRVEGHKTELRQLCELEHPNVVRTVGFLFRKDELNIMMEYMEMSLYEAIHLLEESIEFSEQEKVQIIQQMCSGLKFIHGKGIAHGNLKSPNVLLNYVEGETCSAKLTDYGLIALKNDLETSQPSSETLKAQIWRYAAPEVLSGEILKSADMMKADIWSLSLLMHELIYDEEPYYNLNYKQLKDDVVNKGMKPQFPDNYVLTTEMRGLMDKGMTSRAHDRPDMEYIDSFMRQVDRIYKDH